MWLVEESVSGADVWRTDGRMNEYYYIDIIIDSDILVSVSITCLSLSLCVCLSSDPSVRGGPSVLVSSPGRC